MGLTIDPPPDLVVEVVIKNSSANKMATYAVLGVPEVWRFNDEAFTLLSLLDGSYDPVKVSRVIRGLPATEIATRVTRAEVFIERGSFSIRRCRLPSERCDERLSSL